MKEDKLEIRDINKGKNLQELFLMRTKGIISRENYWEDFEKILTHLQDLGNFIQEKQLKILIDSSKNKKKEDEKKEREGGGIS